jgi:hypothetical protein
MNDGDADNPESPSDDHMTPGQSGVPEGSSPVAESSSSSSLRQAAFAVSASVRFTEGSRREVSYSGLVCTSSVVCTSSQLLSLSAYTVRQLLAST